MQKLLFIFFILFSYSFVQGQTFSGTGGAIPANGVTQTCYSTTVSGVGIINSALGLSQVCLNITHPDVGDLEIVLTAPDGTIVPLSVQNGGTGNNYTSTCFTSNATTSIKFGTAPYSGTYLPEGYLGAVNNGQNANGTWKICIQDRRNSSSSGSLGSWALTFSNTPAPAPPAFPACNITLPSGTSCSGATSICDFSGLCGSTTGTTKTTWPALAGAACFGIENNSFIKFVASATTVSFTVWVPTGSGGLTSGGLQILIYSGICNGPVTTYACYEHIFPYSSPTIPLVTNVTANGLTIGNTYYIMMDGFNGSNTSFRIEAEAGVNILDITPANPNICIGKSVNLTATGGNGTYTWSPATGLSAITGATVSANPVVSTLYTVTSLTSGGCPLTKDVNVVVSDTPVVTTQPSIAPQNICLNGPVNSLSVVANAGSGTITSYQWYITTVANNTGGAAIPFATLATYTPSSASIGSIYFYCKITNSNGCSTKSDISGLIKVSALVATPTATATIQPDCITPTGTIVVTAPAGINIEYSDGGAYQASGTFSGLVPGPYNITARNKISGCISTINVVTINALPAGPAIPAAYVKSQPTCTTPTAVIVVSAPIGNMYEYSVGGAYQSSTVFSGLTNGTTYNITAKDTVNGCISQAFPLSVNTIPGAPAAPSTDVIQPTCLLPTGTITITAPTGASFEYSTGGAYQPGLVFNSLAAGTSYLVTVKDISSGCVSAPVNITIDAVPATTAAPVVSSPVPYCENATAVPLSATGTILLWYIAATGGTGTATAPMPLTTGVSSITYYVSQTVSGCESPRAAITVTTNALPVAPTIATQVTYCTNEATFPLTATGTGLLWYTTATGGIGSSTAPTPSSTTFGSTLYYVSQTFNNCEGPRAVITVTINATPAAPGVTSPVVYCENLPAIALTAAGSNLLWYNVATGGTGTSAAPIPSTTATGSTIYYVSQSTSGCEGPRAAITVTINAAPVAATVTSPVVYCLNAPASALSASGTNLLWYTTATGGTGTATAPTPLTTGVSSIIYYVSQTVSGCEGPRAAITVTTNGLPVTPTIATPVTYCTNEATIPLTATGTGLLWYTTATGGIGSSTAPTPSSTTFGSTLYYVSQTINNCEGPRAVITVTIKASPTTPAATSPVVYCENLPAVALTAAGSNLLWYNVATGGTGTSAAPIPSTTATGNTIYYVSQSINGCEGPRTAITVTINALPAAPTVTTPVVYCQNAPASALSASGTSLRWYTVATGGTGSLIAPVPATNVSGNTTYYVSQTINGCEGPRGALVVTINATPPTPAITSPVFYCENNTAVPLSATGSNLLWYNTATSITGSTTAPTPATITAANTFYYVTQTILGCESPRAAITVTVSPTVNPVTGFKYNPDTICANGINPGPVYGIGFTNGGVFSSSTGLSINAASGNINLSASTPNTYIVTYNYTANGCTLGGSSTSSITIKPQVSSNTIFSYNSPVCINGNNPAPSVTGAFTTGGTYNSTTGLSINVNTGVINLAATTPNTYQITYSLPTLGCRLATSNFSFITIQANTSPVTGFSYNPAAVCPGDNNPVLTRNTGFALGGTFAAVPAGLSIDAVSGAINVAASSIGVYKITYSVLAAGCRVADSTTTTFIVRGVSPPDVNFSYKSIVCKNDVTAIPVTSATFSAGGVFSSTAGLAINAITGVVDLAGSTSGSYVIKYTLLASACSAAASATADITIVTEPQPPALVPQGICNPGPIVLNATGSGIIKWYADAASTNLVNTGNSFSTNITASTSYYLTNTVGTCTSAASLADVKLSSAPAAPALGSDTSICTGDALVLFAGIYNSYLWQDDSKQPTYTVTNSGIYSVTVGNSEGCTNSSSIAVEVLTNCDDIYFPSAFSPNDDGRNDKFGPLGNLFVVSNYSLKIFNRYGEMVFQTNSPYQKWDGTIAGKKYGNINFVWVATYNYRGKIMKTQKGNVLIVK